MKYILVFLGFGFSVIYGKTQTTDNKFEEFYKTIQAKKILLAGINKSDSIYTADLRLSNDTYKLLDKLFELYNDEKRMNGRGYFDFAGNETTKKSIYRFGTGISIDQGLYPYGLYFSADIQSLLNNGVYVANESNIDISYDFHPYIPRPESRIRKYESKLRELQSLENPNAIEKDNIKYLKNKYLKKIENAYDVNGLWLENYVISKRFSDDYLGIEHRYEIGVGFIFSYFSKSLTEKGKGIRDEINKKSTYKNQDQDLISSLKSLTPANNLLQLNPDDIQIISDSRSRFLIANKKRFSKLKISLLAASFYEVEKTIISNTINFNSRDTSITVDVNPTNAIKFVIRPGILWRPKDKYKLKLNPLFIFPFTNIKNVVTEGSYTDERIDYFFYFNSTLDIQVERRFSISLYYKYFYDNAPNRVFLKQLDNTYVLLLGENQRSSFGIGLNFDF